MAQTPEGRVKDKVKKFLKAQGIWYYMPVQTGWGVAGIPDFVCCWDGKFLGIETKAPGKRSNCSVHQLRVRDEIKKSGGLWVVVDSVELLEYWFKHQTCEGFTDAKQKQKPKGKT